MKITCIAILIFILILVIISNISNNEKYGDFEKPCNSLEITNFLTVPLDIFFINNDNDIDEQSVGGQSMIKICMPSSLFKGIIRFKYKNNIIGDYAVDKFTPSKLFIGQIIAKKQYSATGTPSWVDIPELRIHNLTGLPLQFNGNVNEK